MFDGTALDQEEHRSLQFAGLFFNSLVPGSPGPLCTSLEPSSLHTRPFHALPQVAVASPLMTLAGSSLSLSMLSWGASSHSQLDKRGILRSFPRKQGIEARVRCFPRIRSVWQWQT